MNALKRLTRFLVLLLVSSATIASATKPWVLPITDRQVTGSFAPLPAWQQVNQNGFGVPQAGEVSALEGFNGFLYAGTYNATAGARIYRSADGEAWAPVSQPGFGISTDTAPYAILDLMVFNNKLYASTGWRDSAGQIWRTLNGVTWAPMVIAGFGDPDNVDITALANYGGVLYAGVRNQVTGAQIWRSYSGDSNSWTQVAPAAPGTADASVTGLAVFGGGLYAAVESTAPAQIWCSYGGGWTTVMGDGFGSPLTTSTGGLAVFGGYLYAGAGNSSVGAQLWRTKDGATWEPAILSGFGDPNNQKVDLVYVSQNQIYISVENIKNGIGLWRSKDGVHWERANQDGFGDSHNSGTNGRNAATVFRGQLYLGTKNVTDGGEVWQMLLQPLFLPQLQH